MKVNCNVVGGESVGTTGRICVPNFLCFKTHVVWNFQATAKAHNKQRNALCPVNSKTNNYFGYIYIYIYTRGGFSAAHYEVKRGEFMTMSQGEFVIMNQEKFVTMNRGEPRW